MKNIKMSMHYILFLWLVLMMKMRNQRLKDCKVQINHSSPISIITMHRGYKFSGVKYTFEIVALSDDFRLHYSDNI